MAIDRQAEPIATAKIGWSRTSLRTTDSKVQHRQGGNPIISLSSRPGSAVQPSPPEPEPADQAAVQDPWSWWLSVTEVLSALAAKLNHHRPEALCVDGTSATVLLCSPAGEPLTPALMYHHAHAIEQAQWLAERAPASSPARGPTASLAKLLYLRDQLQPRETTLALHQADWISGRLRGQFGNSDWNNALKLGFDPQRLCYPSWLRNLDLGPVKLPRCQAPGTDLGAIDAVVASQTRLPTTLRIRAGTTDSTAATLAAGARQPGDAVTSLGSTLVLKLISERPVEDCASGVYSHRLGQRWLLGGASNTGGAVLRHSFNDRELEQLSARIDPARPTGLDYYPLLRCGERFPIADPDLAPRLSPRPADDSLFMAGLFEGMARIERSGYLRLQALGGPAPTRILTSGGGARNRVWTAIRARVLELPVEAAIHQEAAYGAALLARGDFKSCQPMPA
jgi:sugar (pentulose or hexulose) kinase